MAKRFDSPADKVLVFHFRGGPDDGQSVRSDQPPDAYGAAYALWAMTRKGTKGLRFNWHAADGKSHCYKVVDKQEVSDIIAVTCEHVSSV